MKVEFAVQRPEGAFAIASVIAKGGQDNLGLNDPALRTAAAAQKFEGEAGACVSHFMALDGVTRHIILVGIGSLLRSTILHKGV